MSARKHLEAYGNRASGYLREGYGGVNVEKILTFVMFGAVLYGGYKVVQLIRKGSHAGDDAADAIAKAIVGDPMQAQDGLYYVLPNGLKVALNNPAVQYLGNMTFNYLGVKYKVVKALGGGNYQAEKA